jgi:hypothetical protein
MNRSIFSGEVKGTSALESTISPKFDESQQELMAPIIGDYRTNQNTSRKGRDTLLIDE